MTTLEVMARAHREEAFFHLLFVGAPGPCCEEVCAAARALPGCGRVVAVADLSDRPEGARAVAERESLSVGVRRGCLVVVLDLGAGDGQDLEGTLVRLHNTYLSSQIICFALAPRERLSFRGFLRCVAEDVAGVGDLPECLECLRRWFPREGGPGVPPDLRLPIAKQPSTWLRAISHDHLRGKLKVLTKAQLDAAGVWQDQRLLNVWLTAALQVLEVPWTNYRLRRLEGEADEPPTDLEGVLTGTPPLMVVPAALEAPLSSAGLRAGADFAAYHGPGDAAPLLEEAGRLGRPRVLVRDPAGDTPAAPAGVPTVYVTEDELRLTWCQWQEAFAGNVLGAFSVPEFLSLMPANRQAWGLFCLLPLPQAVDRIVELLLRTYAGLGARPELPHKQERIAELFRLAAQAWSARGLYFGGAGGGAERGRTA